MFSEFAKVWDFEHRTSSHTVHINIKKKIFKEADFEKKDILEVWLC